jgi:hemoglobin
MKRDILEEDLHDLLVAFYATIGRDALLAPYFADIDMSVHIPVIVQFWSTIVFNTRKYSGNAFRPHSNMPGLTAKHFARWVATLESTVSERFSGMRADHMKTMAHRIAYSMQLRLGISPVEEAPIHQTSA